MLHPHAFLKALTVLLHLKNPGLIVSAVAIALLLSASISNASPGEYFGIRFVDEQTGRGVPLVEMKTTFKARYISDSNGYVAFFEPGLAGKEVWFDIASAGYESPNGPFGMKGSAFTITPGKIVEVKLHRENIAERLYRMTGYGIYRDTVLLGKKPPIEQPLLNGQVCGSDSLQVAIFKNRYFWFWQDTDRLSFSLGNFRMTGATAPLPDKLNLDNGIDFTYFTEKPGGFARPMTDVPQKEPHPVWCDGMTVVKDDHGDEHMLADYITANKDMSPAERGLLLWNEKREIFEVLKKYDSINEIGPRGNPTRVRVGSDDYLYFPSPYAEVRVKATFADASDPSHYEAFTCLKPGSTYSAKNPALDRREGKLMWSWQRGAKPVTPSQVDEWVKSNLVRREDTPFQMQDAQTGKPIIAHGGSIAWNPTLKKWTMLFGQSFGDSLLGELWFATATAPEGPWRAARKVASHAKPKDNNDCYNPLQHPELARDNGRYIFFEGTFVNTFSGNPITTPYYDYNNIMYRLDVTDPRVNLPEPPAALNGVPPVDPAQ